MQKILAFLLLLSSYLNSSAEATASGYLKGTLLLDDTWERTIYMSLIETIEREHAVSKNMIVASSPIDSLGRFSIQLNQLSTDWSFLRLHLVKKGISSASLVIGGLDENHCFIVAHRSSKIVLQNTVERPVFNNVTLSGAPYMKTFELIKKLAHYPNSLNHENSLIEKEFIEEVVHEKLKRIADTCKHPFISLYAIYQTDFHSDFQTNPDFAEAYLSKWENENSTYFESFRRQLPVSKTRWWHYLFLLSIVGLLTVLGIRLTLISRKKGKIKKLSVQERKIFELMQRGASNQDISDEFHIELSTVKSHVSSIFSKLNIKARKEAINMKIK